MDKVSFLLIFYSPCFYAGRDWQRIQLHLGLVIPYSANLKEGDSITVYCGSISIAIWSYIPPSEYSGQPVSRKHCMGYRNITLSNLLQNDSGVYICQSFYRTNSFSDIFSVQVWQEVPNGLVVPSWIEVSGGSSVTLTCGSSTPVIWFSVYYNSLNKTVIGNTLTLHNLQGKQSGYYVCRGTTLSQHHIRSIFHSSSRLIVNGYLEVTFDL